VLARKETEGSHRQPDGTSPYRGSGSVAKGNDSTRNWCAARTVGGMNDSREGPVVLTFEFQEEKILLVRPEASELAKWIRRSSGLDSDLPTRLQAAARSDANRTVTLSGADCYLLRNVPELMALPFALTGLELLAFALRPRGFDVSLDGDLGPVG
jgi:hypothetical protein